MLLPTVNKTMKPFVFFLVLQRAPKYATNAGYSLFCSCSTIFLMTTRVLYIGAVFVVVLLEGRGGGGAQVCPKPNTGAEIFLFSEEHKLAVI